MNVEIGTEAPIFLFWEYLFQIFGILSLQCSVKVRRSAKLLARMPNAKAGPGFEPRPVSLGEISPLSSSGEDKPKGLLYNCAF
jgi:hypothetical protein